MSQKPIAESAASSESNAPVEVTLQRAGRTGASDAPSRLQNLPHLPALPRVFLQQPLLHATPDLIVPRRHPLPLGRQVRRHRLPPRVRRPAREHLRLLHRPIPSVGHHILLALAEGFRLRPHGGGREEGAA